MWEGSAFECAGNEITLTNSEFGSPRAYGICNAGAIVGRGLSVENDCYTSHLNITLDAGFQGQTVRCSVDNGTHSNEVGHDTLSITTGGLKTHDVLQYTNDLFFLFIRTFFNTKQHSLG